MFVHDIMFLHDGPHNAWRWQHWRAAGSSPEFPTYSPWAPRCWTCHQTHWQQIVQQGEVCCLRMPYFSLSIYEAD